MPLLLVALVALMGSCVGDDIDNLQNQIDDLNEQVDQLEALLAAIADLQASITALQAEVEAGDSELADQYASLLNSLTLLEEEVANNASAIFYGNLLTNEDFEAFKTQGATIVTGKVIATSQAHIDALAAIKMVGGNLNISGGTTVSLDALQNVGGSLYVTELMEEGVSVSLPALASVGDAVMVTNNPALTSFMADALVLINAELQTMGNPMLTSLSFMALDQVASIYINEEWIGNPDYTGRGSLVEAKLSSTNVLGDVECLTSKLIGQIEA